MGPRQSQIVCVNNVIHDVNLGPCGISVISERVGDWVMKVNHVDAKCPYDQSPRTPWTPKPRWVSLVGNSLCVLLFIIAKIMHYPSDFTGRGQLEVCAWSLLDSALCWYYSVSCCWIKLWLWVQHLYCIVSPSSKSQNMKVVLVSSDNRKANQSILLVLPWDLLSWVEVLRAWLGLGDSLVAYSNGSTLKKDQMVNISGFTCHLVSCNRAKTCIIYFLNKVLSTLWNIHSLTTSSTLAL